MREAVAERITVVRAVIVAKPVVKETRIPGERVLAHLAHNPRLANWFGAYPNAPWTT